MAAEAGTLTPAQIQAGALDNNQIGSSGLAGVHTKIFVGDPAKPGLYAILTPSFPLVKAGWGMLVRLDA